MDRQKNIQQLKEKELDVLIIGGGITGAGIALDAQSRGLQAGLIEMQDFAAGTSSRSTKLVHGGLRYLKQFQVGVVAEVGKERAIVYENAPHVTSPEWMLLPIIKGGTFGPLSTSIGLYVYDKLAGVKRKERRKMLSKDQALKMEPLLKEDILKGAGYYVEYKTDDARLTLEVMKKADETGAFVSNYIKALSFIYKDGKIVGVEAQDTISGETFQIFAKNVVNAAGIWSDELRAWDRSLKGKKLFHTKGVHLVFDQKVFPLKQAVYFDTPDKRMVFAIPRAGKTYLGTTDTKYTDDLKNPEITVEDRDYLLNTVGLVFDNLRLTPEDIESYWVGIRPLIYEEGKKESEISRKDEVFHSDSGLLTIAGGKLTGYRKMAEKVVDIVAKRLGINAKCHTDKIILSGGNVGGSAKYQTYTDEYIQKGIQIGLSQEEAHRIVTRYGSNTEKIYTIITNEKDKAAEHGLSLEVYGTLRYGIEEEMVQTPLDYLNRRTSAVLFNIDWAKKWEAPIVAYLQKHFQWDDDTSKKLVVELEKEMHVA